MLLMIYLLWRYLADMNFPQEVREAFCQRDKTQNMRQKGLETTLTRVILKSYLNSRLPLYIFVLTIRTSKHRRSPLKSKIAGAIEDEIKALKKNTWENVCCLRGRIQLAVGGFD